MAFLPLGGSGMRAVSLLHHWLRLHPRRLYPIGRDNEQGSHDYPFIFI